MPEEANALIMENINKNAVDLDEYPATQNIHNRCVSMSMLAPFPSPEALTYRAFSCQSLEGSEGEQSFGDGHSWIIRRFDARRVGSQEAVAREPKGRRKGLLPPQHSLRGQRPSMRGEVCSVSGVVAEPCSPVLTSSAPSYWDVEARIVPVSVESEFIMDTKNAIQFIDENTIGVVVILGSTYTGHFENVQEMNDLRQFSVVLSQMMNVC